MSDFFGEAELVSPLVRTFCVASHDAEQGHERAECKGKHHGHAESKCIGSSHERERILALGGVENETHRNQGGETEAVSLEERLRVIRELVCEEGDALEVLFFRKGNHFF